MNRVRSALLSTLAIGATALLPAVAEARDHGRGGGYYDNRGYDRGYYGGRGNYRHHDDNDDALAAGVIGLALGAIIGSAVTSSNQQRYYQPAPRGYYPPPPPAYYPPPQGGYYGGPSGYSAGPPVCVLRERVWDPYAGQYVRVERRVPC